jgi:peptide/nickel transport system substrate-binding protein
MNGSLRRGFFLLCLLAFLDKGVFAQEKPRYGGALRVAVFADLFYLNPFRDARPTDGSIRSLVYEGLTDVDRDLRVIPHLAEAWEIAKDAKAYTFKLRKGVRFQDGADLTAQDVEWTLRYIMDPKNKAYAQGLFEAVTAIESSDSHTIRISLREPYAPFLVTAQHPIVPRGSLTADRTTTAPVGTGPFALREWKPGQLLRLTRNPYYWQKGVPYLDEILMQPILDETVRFAALRSGDVDFVDRIPEATVEQIKAGKFPDIRYAFEEAAGSWRLRMNVRKAPWSDVRVRQAVAWALDKEEIARAATWGLGKPAAWRFPKGSFWYVELPERERNRDRARELLKQAGYGGGIKATLPSSVSWISTSQVVKFQLEQIGIQVDLQPMEFGAYRRRIDQRDFDILVSGMPLRSDPHELLYHYFHSKLVNSTNIPGYANPEVDQLLDEGRTTLDALKRKKIYARLAAVLHEEVPEFVLYLHPIVFGFRSYVQGFTPEVGRGTLGHTAGRGGLSGTWINR